MIPPRFRGFVEQAPTYGHDSEYFTLVLHHRGIFFDKPNNVSYEHGVVLIVDYVHPSLFTRRVIDKLLHACDPQGKLHFYYRKQNRNELMKIWSEEDVKAMFMDRGTHRVLEIYVAESVMSKALTMDPFDECYIPRFDEENFEFDQYENVFYEGQEDIWRQLEANLAFDVGAGDGARNVEVGNENVEEIVGDEEVEDLVESDYEREDDQVDSDRVNERVNVDFGFGGLEGQEVSDIDTEYGSSEELRSLASDEEDEAFSRNRERSHSFNPTMDMEEPTFREGLIFESKTVLNAAITKHSVKHSRAIKYKKDDAVRLRAVCDKTCSWVLYATKEGKKPSFIIKTYRGEHTCPMVYANRRVSSTFLATKYETDWRADPNMSVSAFINKVKRDNLGDISVWTAYRSKVKAMEKIMGTVVKHYKLLWDYCEELRRTNPGTTTQLEGHAGEFKRLYICLGALKEGFRCGCRRVIGLDGCFLKTELKGQLLTAVGIDGNNGIYPIAYAVVEIENTEHWTWGNGA